MKPTKTNLSLIRNRINRSALRRGFFLIALTSFALSPTARAVTPLPDGGYANDNTAEGDGALFKLTTGVENTAVGFKALFSLTTGDYNTAVGSLALVNSKISGANTAIGYGALESTTGDGNTAVGADALTSNTTGR